MTEPVVAEPARPPVPIGPPAAGVPVATRGGKVYVTNPISGATEEHDPDTAAELVFARGWVPNDERSAEAVRARQIPQDVAAEQPALGKLGYGVLRGVATPLIDLSLPAGSRVHEVLAEDSPWSVTGGEVAGMLGTLGVSALGRGAAAGAARLAPVALLDEAAQAVGRSLGAGNGLVRGAFARGAQGALEGGAYGAMNALTEAHQHNEELTAQRLGSEIIPGMLFGGVLGAGLGAAEGGLGRLGRARTVGDRLAEADKGKLDEIFRAGVSDDDALRIAKSEFGVEDPGALTRFQAAASGDDVTPERLQLLKDSGPVGARARHDAFSSAEELAAAERDILDKGNDYLVGREEAMRQVQGNVKNRHIARMIGDAEVSEGDVARLVRQQVVDSGDWAADLSRRSAFVDGVIEQLDDQGLEKLQRALGARRGVEGTGELRERLLSGLTKNQNETLEALEASVRELKLSDEGYRGLGGGLPEWTAKPQAFIEKWRARAEELAALPKGVNDSGGDLKKILGNLEFAEQSLLRDPRRVAAGQLDNLKKRLTAFAEPGDRLGAGSGVAAAAREMYEDLRLILEDPSVWGTKFAGYQARTNALLHRNIGVMGEFDDAFVKEIGLPDPDSKGWRNARVVDSEKITKALGSMSEPKQLEQLNRIRDHLEDQKKFFQEMLEQELDPRAHIRVQAAIKQTDQLRAAIDRGVYLNAAQRQAKALLGFGPLGSGWEARAALGAVVGGPMGAVAGLGVSAALNPGKMLQFRAIAERMAKQTGSRVWHGVSGLLGLNVSGAAAQAAGFAGRGAGHATRVSKVISAMLAERGSEREETYQETLRQLAEARQRLPELNQKLGSTMPVIEQALPGVQNGMMNQAARGIDFVLSHVPSVPQQRLYGVRSMPLSDADYSGFVKMTMAALDPPSILDMAVEGELSPKAVAAAESAAPEFVNYIRSEIVRAITDHGPESIAYEHRVQASLLMGTPLDASMEPDFIAMMQATHESRAKRKAEMKDGGGRGGETGVTMEYASKADSLESDKVVR